jgi:regulator of protease activity HflC (stomatin/prohibitin superfamily)
MLLILLLASIIAAIIINVKYKKFESIFMANDKIRHERAEIEKQKNDIGYNRRQSDPGVQEKFDELTARDNALYRQLGVVDGASYTLMKLSRLVAPAISVLLLVGILISYFIFIKPGEVGVIVNLFGDKQGVQQKELSVGVHFILPWKEVYTFPIFEQNHQWSGENGFNFQSSEGLSVHADVGINFHLEQNKVHELFCKYRRGMDEITNVFIKNILRDAINRVGAHMTTEDLNGDKKDVFFIEVQKMVSEELESIGFKVSHIFAMGKFVMPDTVIAALNEKIASTQRAQQRENELREAEAQARKDVAQAEGVGLSKVVAAKADAESLGIEAKAKADANNMLNRSLTPELLKYQAIQRWNGILPSAMGGDGASFLIDLKR